MAKIPRVENFLFCYPLRSGILFLSSLTVVINTLQLLVLAFMYDSVMAGVSYQATSPEETELYSTGNPAFSRGAGQTLGFGLATIIINVSLIIGVLYKKPNCFIPWLAIAGFSLGVLVLALVVLPILSAIYLSTMPAFTAGVFFLILIIIGCYFHVFCVVHTYYRELKEHKEVDVALVPQDPVKTGYSNFA